MLPPPQKLPQSPLPMRLTAWLKPGQLNFQLNAKNRLPPLIAVSSKKLRSARQARRAVAAALTERMDWLWLPPRKQLPVDLRELEEARLACLPPKPPIRRK